MLSVHAPSAPSVRPVAQPQPAGHEWTLRWMDGSAVSCGIVYDAEITAWRVWIVCNRQLSPGGPAFADESAASTYAQALKRDWALDLPALDYLPLARAISLECHRLRRLEQASSEAR